jgi:hypothetical protein
MSSVVLEEKFTIDGVLTDVTSVKLSDPTVTFGVKRNDTGDTVVKDDTVMPKVSTGVYRYTFTEPAAGLTYTYWVEWVYAGETYHDEHTIAGAVAATGICTLSDIKDRLGIVVTDYDAAISRIINGVESLFDSYTGRSLIITAADITEYYTGCGPSLQVRRFPIVSLTSIKESISYEFDAGSLLITDQDYRIITGGKFGIIQRLWTGWLDVPDSIEVIYRGGYCSADVVPGEGETALPSDLREAAIEQAIFIWKRKDDLGLSSVSAEGGSINKFSDMDLLPMVKRILDRYRLPSL